MNLSKNDLKKIQYDFNSWSNRLLQADFNDYLDVLTKYIAFLKTTQIIYDYICDCGNCDQSYRDEFISDINESQNRYCYLIFETGLTEAEEVRNVFAILQYIVDNKIEVHRNIARGYSSSTDFQDKIKGFNDRFVMILIRYIEKFLTKAGIDMGLDDKHVYNISVQNGQSIIAGNNSNISATNKIGVDTSELHKLIDAIKQSYTSLSDTEKEEVDESLEVIETEISAEKPKKSFLKTAITTLKAIKGTAEFGAAVATLVQFVSAFKTF